jgi:amiloride-sensitive sodium channel
MTLERRNCILSDENLNDTNIQMDAFNDYSRSSCLLECRARLMQEECGCLPYYFPNFGKVWNKNTTCNRTGLDCLSNVAGEYQCQCQNQYQYNFQYNFQLP